MVQRYHAHTDGIGLIAWAFDPLQAGNAHFNLARLGATSCRYIDNMYGPRTDTLNAGVPTDRLIAEWEVERPMRRREAHGSEELAVLPRLIQTESRAEGQVVPVGIKFVADAPRVLLEVPARIADLRRGHPEVAEAWRMTVRQAFQTSFAAGFRAVGLVRDVHQGERRCYYELERPSLTR